LPVWELKASDELEAPKLAMGPIVAGVLQTIRRVMRPVMIDRGIASPERLPGAGAGDQRRDNNG